MAKHILFLVHGVGRHTDSPLGDGDPDNWAKGVIASLQGAVAAYPRIDADDVVFVPVLYDDVFYSHAANWDALASQLSGTPIESLTNWMNGAIDKGFLWDNVGDIIMYRGLRQVRQHVITHVATQFAEAIETYGSHAHYSILAHSLGTAVAHDTVQKLAKEGIDGNTSLQPPSFRFSNFFGLANVSRLVWATDERFYGDTNVRPSKSGLDADNCAVNRYINFRHVADPIPSIVRFTPPGWDQSLYASLEVKHVRDADVHGFTHYLANPRVSDLVLEAMLGQNTVVYDIRRERIQRFKNYEDPFGSAKRDAVEAVRVILDAISWSPTETFHSSISEIAKQLVANRNTIANAMNEMS